MSFVLRRPFVVASARKHTATIANPATTTSSSLLRTFHSAPTTRSSILAQTASIRSQALHPLRNGFRRSYNSGPNPSYATPRSNSAELRQRLLFGAGIFGGTLLAINLIFNRETRDDGGMPPFERAYLNDTFLHTGLGLGIIGLAARTLHTNGWSYRLMAMNPWLVAGVGLVASIGSMYGTLYTSPDNYVQKYALWGTFNLSQAFLLSPLFFMSPALLARAGLYTAGMMGSIAFVGATAKQDKYLYLGAPLLAGVTVVALSGLAPLVIPATAARTLMVTENLWLYGGLVVFGGFTLYDVQRVLHHARLAERGLRRRDPVNESVSLELDFINIFIRMVQILAMSGNRRK